MKVHAALSNGFQEVIYQRALKIEMEEVNLRFARELNILVYYKGQQIGERRVDFFVEEENNGGIKSYYTIRKCPFSTSKKLFGAYNMQVGLLINFGSISLQFKRLENAKFIHTSFPLNP
jgi:GxxExxY protein